VESGLADDAPARCIQKDWPLPETEQASRFGRVRGIHSLGPRGLQGGVRAAAALAGCFPCEPPPGVVWKGGDGMLLQ